MVAVNDGPPACRVGSAAPRAGSASTGPGHTLNSTVTAWPPSPAVALGRPLGPGRPGRPGPACCLRPAWARLTAAQPLAGMEVAARVLNK